MGQFIKMGSCHKAHGIKGAFDFHLLNPVDSSLREGLEVKLTPKPTSELPPEGKLYKIDKIQFGNKVIVYLQGVDDRNIVEKMLPFDFWMDRKYLPAPEEGEFYLEELIGLKAYTPEGKPVGEIETYFDNGVQAILVLKKNNGKKIELPFVDNFFPEVDLEAQKIVVIEPELI